MEQLMEFACGGESVVLWCYLLRVWCWWGWVDVLWCCPLGENVVLWCYLLSESVVMCYLLGEILVLSLGCCF